MTGLGQDVERSALGVGAALGELPERLADDHAKVIVDPGMGGECLDIRMVTANRPNVSSFPGS